MLWEEKGLKVMFWISREGLRAMSLVYGMACLAVSHPEQLPLKAVGTCKCVSSYRLAVVPTRS